MSSARLLGCASSPANTLAPGHAGAPGVKRFLVCAPNTVIALPAELKDATAPLREQVDAYLRFHEREAQWLDLYQSKQLWIQAMAAAKQEGALEKTPVFFAKTRRALRLRRDRHAFAGLTRRRRTTGTPRGTAWHGRFESCARPSGRTAASG